MEEDKLSKYVKLPTFDGEAEKIQLWLVRFMAYAACSGFKKALGDTAERDLPMLEVTVESLDPAVDIDKLKIAAAKRNQVAVANLTMAMTTEKAMVAVYEAQDADWPSGLAWKILEALKNCSYCGKQGHKAQDENESDMMTKNTSEKLFTKFAERVRNGNLQIREEWDRIVWEIDNPIGGCRELDRLRTDRGSRA